MKVCACQYGVKWCLNLFGVYVPQYEGLCLTEWCYLVLRPDWRSAPDSMKVYTCQCSVIWCLNLFGVCAQQYEGLCLTVWCYLVPTPDCMVSLSDWRSVPDTVKVYAGQYEGQHLSVWRSMFDSMVLFGAYSWLYGVCAGQSEGLRLTVLGSMTVRRAMPDSMNVYTWRYSVMWCLSWLYGVCARLSDVWTLLHCLSHTI